LIDSVSFVDQKIVIDSGSDDHAIAMAQARGARVGMGGGSI
jgi:hypothetical protein